MLQIINHKRGEQIRTVNSRKVSRMAKKVHKLVGSEDPCDQIGTQPNTHSHRNSTVEDSPIANVSTAELLDSIISFCLAHNVEAQSTTPTQISLAVD